MNAAASSSTSTSSTSTSTVSKPPSKARLAKLAAAVDAVAGLGVSAQFASAGPRATDVAFKTLDTRIAYGSLVLSITGPDVVMFRYGTHALSEYFTVSFTTLSGAGIGTAGEVLVSSGVSGIGYPTISTAALLSRTVEIHGEGSITLSAYDGTRIVSKTVKVVNETTTLVSTTIVPAPQVSPIAVDAPTTTWPVVAPVTQPTTTTTMAPVPTTLPVLVVARPSARRRCALPRPGLCSKNDAPES